MAFSKNRKEAQVIFFPHMNIFLFNNSGGTGLTPIYQIIQAAIKDPEDKTELRLLFANKTPEGNRFP